MEFFSDELNACRNWMEVIKFEINAIGECGDLSAYKEIGTESYYREILVILNGLIGCAKAVEGLSLCVKKMYTDCLPYYFYEEERGIELKKYEDAVAAVDDPYPPIHIYNDCT